MKLSRLSVGSLALLGLCISAALFSCLAPCGAASTESFEAEVPELMNIIIYSLYKNMEIFMRELISNASDALEKLRRAVASDSQVLDTIPKTHEYSIRVVPDRANRRLVILDSGVGMDKDELRKYLGNIASSGTKEFLKNLKDHSPDTNLIGQFGVGFYSAFLVADDVSVVSKSYKSAVKYLWHSNIKENTFSVEPIDDAHPYELEYPTYQGTKIILHIKDNLTDDGTNPDQKDFFDESVLKGLIRKYSEFIDFPIYLLTNKTIVDEVPIEEEAPADDSSLKVEDLQDESEKPKTRTVTSYKTEWEQVNLMKPIWTREASSIPAEEYNSFYKALTKDSSDPLDYYHFKVEGDSNYRGIIFIPSQPPFEAFTKSETGKPLKLYMKRVFITDEFFELFPRYISFIRVVLDIEDIPLNVSRENLQKHKVLMQVRDYIISKSLSMIARLASNSTHYDSFYSKYSGHIKLGLITEESSKRKVTLSEFLRFKSSFSLQNNTSLDEYVSRMKPNQTDIYFVTGSSVKEMARLPQIAKALKRNYEVVYMDEPFDEYVVQYVTEFKEKSLKNLAKSGVKFDSLDSTGVEEVKEKFKPLTSYLAKLLNKRIEKVEVSDSLEPPMAIMSSAYGWTPQMVRLMKNNRNDPMSSFFANQKLVMEINPYHPLMISLLEQIIQSNSSPSDEINADIQLLYNSALLNSGYDLPSVSSFALSVENVLRQKYGHSAAPAIPEDQEDSQPSFSFGDPGEQDFANFDDAEAASKEGESRHVHEDL